MPLLAPPTQPAASPRFGVGAASVALHALVLLALIGALHHAPELAPYKYPGTAKGAQLLTFYSPGSPEHAISDLATPQADKATPLPALHTPQVSAPTPAPLQAPAADPGSGTSAQSGLGDGDISIALQKYFPYPTPNIQALPHGTRGDVILNAVIDENGKITDLTLLHGLGPTIDDAVIATVRQWTYSPATKNGNPVRSEQELHFHYERT